MKNPFPYLYSPVLPLLLLLFLSGGKNPPVANTTDVKEERCCRIVFYNTENLFDIYDDSLKRDDDFTPGGGMHWNRTRYEAKLNGLSKVLVAAAGWQPADIIGLCEVENRSALEDLVQRTILSKYNYRIVHKDSDDPRGIDVALLYNSETVTFIESNFYNLNMKGLLTRDILHLKAILCTDTCHLFVNHWPSRSSGQLETEPARMAAAALLRAKIDSLLQDHPQSRIIVMGDFNDEPEDISLSGTLEAQTHFEHPDPGKIYNLATGLRSPSSGTLKYQGQWSVFDQIMVSGIFLLPGTGSRTERDRFTIFAEDFLLEEDTQYNGRKPFRTYLGYRYLGGFSDHLPVYADLYR